MTGPYRSKPDKQAYPRTRWYRVAVGVASRFRVYPAVVFFALLMFQVALMWFKNQDLRDTKARLNTATAAATAAESRAKSCEQNLDPKTDEGLCNLVCSRRRSSLLSVRHATWSPVTERRVKHPPTTDTHLHSCLCLSPKGKVDKVYLYD